MFAFLKLIMSAIWSSLWPSVQIYATKEGIFLFKSAVKAVKMAYLMGSEVSGTDKRKAAYDMVAQDLENQKIVIDKNQVYNAVVSAYQDVFGTKE